MFEPVERESVVDETPEVADLAERLQESGGDEALRLVDSEYREEYVMWDSRGGRWYGVVQVYNPDKHGWEDGGWDVGDEGEWHESVFWSTLQRAVEGAYDDYEFVPTVETPLLRSN